ncbi:MAG TPA: DEAD/DEAH box helicase, partial [Clostridiales bacterium]|nr:DEAD/DEAH box helicase [Clostridiales bacterium]
DLSRISGKSNGLDLERLNWSNYDLVVIDESHNFRNGGETYGGDEQRENRYLRLLNKVIRPGVKTKVLMLSATPVNNRFYDLRNQLALAYEGDSSSFSKKLRINRNIDDVFRNAQRAYNAWCELDMKERTTSRLLQMLDFDFFEVLDSVTIARSRKHIEKFYNTIDIGKFPERMPPITHRPSLTPLNNAINYNEIYELLMHMNLSLYTPSDYIFPSRRDKYMDLNHESSNRLTQAGRERGIQKLMSINLLKRLESSVYSFKLTLQRIKTQIENTIVIIDSYRAGTVIDVIDIAESDDFDLDDQNTEYFTAGKKMKIDLDDMDYKSWRDHLAQDNEILELLLEMIEDITPDYDKKLQTLLEVIRNKIENPINPGNKKIIIFTAFSDTAEYLYDNVSKYVKQNFNLYTAMITGSVDGRTTIPGLRADFNTVLTCFSPVSKEKELLLPNNPHEIDILIATDCISEGQNLQDCDYLTNYDIHWNPVRIIQRFGRIDRIGSYNERIQLVNFWPDITLDDYINLKSRVETRMKISIMTSTGDDDPINVDEKGDLEYRKQQLKRLQEEVVDIEDMSGGVSIMDLGLNEFRLDLLEYVKKNPDLDKTPLGMHAVVNSSEDIPPGVIYVLRNINDGINKENQNRLHPFYIVYITEDGEIASNHLESKKTLDLLRYVCRGETEPIEKAYKRFNAETDDGRSMTKYSNLLQETIESIIHISEESDIDSLFRPGGTTALRTNISEYGAVRKGKHFISPPQNRLTRNHPARLY